MCASDFPAFSNQRAVARGMYHSVPVPVAMSSHHEPSRALSGTRHENLF